MMRHTRARWFGLTLLLLSLAAVARGQEASVSDAPRPAPRPASARREGNQLRVNGKPTVLLWAKGLSDPKGLDAYVAAGFNTLAVPITDVSEKPLAQAFDLATAAEEQGLYVLGVLSPAKLVDADGREVAFDPAQDSYPEAVRAYVQKATEEFGRHPRLLAWVVDLNPDRVVWGDAGFRQFLSGAYKSIGDLNASWGSEFEDFSAISCGGVRDLDTDRPGGIGRASLDFAYYRQKTYTDAVGIWTKALEAADSRHLALAGGLTDYRSAIGLEEGLDGLVMETTSQRAESDYATANVQAVDIARRGNRLLAMQTLDISTQPSADTVRNWINLALLHGACGVQFASWSDLADAEDVRTAVKQAADGIAASGAFPLKPMARAAMVYEPYAGGAMRDGKSLYGYLEGTTEREPTDLFYTVRNGSRYGLMDVLSADTLAQADLSQYGALIVPTAFYLTDKTQALLHQFALQGGILVADAGVGMYQARGEVGSLPDILRDTFGVLAADAALEEGKTDETPGTVKTFDPAKPGAAVSGKATYIQSVDDTIRELQELLGEPEVSKTLGVDADSADGLGLRTHGLGKGIAVYTPAFLYQQWDPEADGYAEFHDHVLGWQPDLRISEPDSLWPPVEAVRTDEDAVALVTPGGVATALRCYGESNQLYRVPQGAVRVWEPSADEPTELLFPGEALALATPVPITVTPQEEGTSATVAVLRYEAGAVSLEIHGTDAVAAPGGDGVVIQGGTPTAVAVAISTGAFPITPGRSYHIVVEEDGKTTADYTAMPDSDAKALTVQGTFRAGHLTITPAAGG